jgi:ATP-dependent exoDNAse (exonuclease V) beta subunit
VFVGSIDKAPKVGEATHLLEDLLVPFSSTPRKLANIGDRATQDLVRFYYVAYTRAENVLVLFGSRAHFDKATVSVGRV